MTSPSIVLLAALAVLAASQLQGAPQTDRLAPGPPHKSHLEVGEFPPTTFTLPSAADGALFDLEAQRGERPILLLFFRGTW